MQRAARWNEASLRREFMIIREEIERTVRRSVPKQGTLALADALVMVNRFVESTARILCSHGAAALVKV